MTDPPLFPVADDGGDGAPEEPLGTLTVEDDLDPGPSPAPAPAQADDYQADEAHDWTGGPPS